MEAPMTGWKTKVGAYALAIGTACLSASDIAPDPTAAEWIRFAGKLLTGLGGALATFGIGHKIQKGQTAIEQTIERINAPKPINSGSIVRR
jgi:hypothetical protein